jgi:hypothetical protein
MPASGLAYRRGLALRARELLELVHVVDRVFVVRQYRKAVGQVLQAVLRDQVRARVQCVPARPIEWDGAPQPRRGLVEEHVTSGGAERQPVEIGECPCGFPCGGA